jgi:heme o synthase
MIQALALMRLPLSAAVAGSALAGAILAAGSIERGSLLIALGVLLLTAGASAANQVQEREHDRRMIRTRQRPVAAGRMVPQTALGIALLLAAAGLFLLQQAGNPCPLALGLAGLICYNGLYTPLKKRSLFAILPGALCGAIPPVIGWSAAGGALDDFRILLIAGLFFIWQIPHFWILAGRHRRDYQRAHLPTFFEKFSQGQLTRIFSMWAIALAIASLTLPACGLLSPPLSILWLGLAAWLLAGPLRVLLRPSPELLLHHLVQPVAIFPALLCTSLVLQTLLQ